MRSLFLKILLLLLLFSSVPLAFSQSGVTLTASAGFDSFYKGDNWLPVQISVANSGPPIEGELRVVLGQAGDDDLVYNAPISLPTQSDKRVTLYVSVPRSARTPVVELRDGDGRLLVEQALSGLVRLPPDNLLYGVVSSDVGEFTFLERIVGRRSVAKVAFLELDQLPETAVVWSSLDVLVFNDVDTGQLSSAQLDALKAWISNGGQLVVTGGAGWQKTVTAVADLLPVTVTDTQTVDDLSALSDAVGIPFRDAGPYLVTTSSLRNGELLYRQDTLPLLASQTLGRGQVYFLALDPQSAPLIDWDGSDLIWERIATAVSSPSPWTYPLGNTYAAIEVVSTLPSLALPPVWQLLLFLLAYIFVVGPLNYFILKRRRQLERAWLTIPVIIVLFSGFTYVMGFRQRGQEAIINQVSVALSQAGADEANVQTLLGLYSPRRSTYDLTLPADVVARPFDTSFGTFDGIPNMNGISLGNELVIDDLRVDVGGMEAFTVQSYQPALSVDGQVSLETRDGTVRLVGTVQNNSDTRLTTTSLLVSGMVFAVGDLAPGQSKSIDEPFSTSPSSTFSSRPFPVVPGSGSLVSLSAYADTILDSSDYYNDAKLYPRWQLLSALDEVASSIGGFQDPQIATLIAWMDTPQVDARVERPFTTSSTTLYLVELPLTQNLTSGQNIAIPISFWEWETLEANNVYDPAIQNLSLNGGTLAIEYVPWSEFQAMPVESFAIAINAPYPDENVPIISVWNWESETWQQLSNPIWGENEIADFQDYIGLNNVVRLRLQDQSEFGVFIESVYPVLTGDLE